MVVLNRIYTRTGDAGDTALGNGARVAKHSLRVAAYGTVDEVNATVGLARLRTRAQDSDAVIAGRMAKSRDEISHWGEYDYVIVNRDIDTAEAELKTILLAERARADRQPGLNDFVRGLNREFDTRQTGA